MNILTSILTIVFSDEYSVPVIGIRALMRKQLSSFS